MTPRRRGEVMKGLRFADNQIVLILPEADKDPVAKVVKRYWGERAIDLRVAQEGRRSGYG